MTDPGDRIRDAFFGLGAGASEAAQQAVLAAVAGIDPEPITRWRGLALSHVPTARFKRLRFVESSELDETVRARFARPCAELPELAAAFVDPCELSYRNFENILGLDRLFGALEPTSIRFAKAKRAKDGILRTTARVSDPLRTRLDSLDSLGVYAQPLSSNSHDGLRFIFHCAALADAMTDAVREALPKSMLRGFVHINPVFRCNRFEPGDRPFVAHVDSPYYHRSRHHVSKYTLLVYLTPGRGKGVLRFGDERVIDEISAMEVFVFDQRLEHQGRPYTDGRKVYLRTELVFEDPDVEHDPGIAALFAKACYLGSESLFEPELTRIADQAYIRAAAAHWRGPTGPTGPETFVHKQFRGVHFVTNGYDAWFRKGDLGVVECVAILLLDLLNAKIGNPTFRQLCTTELLVRATDDLAWVAELLRDADAPPEPVFARLNRLALFPEPEEDDDSDDFPNSPDFDPDPFPTDWDATRNRRVLDAYVRARRYAMKRIFAAPITMLGQEVFLDPSRFVVESDKVHVLSRDSLDLVHFAAAVFFDPDDFIGVNVNLDAWQPLVPPITYRETGDVIHLMCDLFRNSWMVSHRSERVPVPYVIDGQDVDPDSAAWFNAAAQSTDRKRLRAELDADDDS